VAKASGKLEDLVDDVQSADSSFTEVVKYYGEEDKNMSSSEFYGIFKTFVTSYKVCRSFQTFLRKPTFFFFFFVEM
jgi:cytokinesis protein